MRSLRNISPFTFYLSRTARTAFKSILPGLTQLKRRMKRKAALFPGRWILAGLDRIRTLSEFDERYTAPDGGYSSGADYYDRSGACNVIDSIAIPTLIITAQDDPFIPYSMFTVPLIQHRPEIRVIAPLHGGHCGLAQNGEDPFWAENRIVDFLQELHAPANFRQIVICIDDPSARCLLCHEKKPTSH